MAGVNVAAGFELLQLPVSIIIHICPVYLSKYVHCSILC